jgi:RNA polymerase sigma-70 factor (ECF subfamily)
LLEDREARDSLAESLDREFALELYEEAKARVQLRISPVTWQAFELIAWEKWSGARVAAHLHMTVAAVYMAKKRVQRMLTEEIHKLEGSPVESEGSP